MRLVKIIAALVLGLVLVVIAGAVALFAWVDPADYRAPIEQQVAQRTGRAFRIAGPIELKLLPWLSLSVRDASLGNAPGFGNEPFAQLRQASIGVRLLPLLRSRLEVSRIAVDGLVVNLVARGEANNWSDLSKVAAGSPGTPDGAKRTTSIAGIDLHDAQLSWRDLAAGSTWRLSGLEVHTGTISGDQPVKTVLEFVADRGGPVAVAKLRIDALAKLPADSTRIELTGVTVAGEWYEKAAPGGAAGQSRPALVLRQPEPKEGLIARPIRVAAPSLVLDWDAGTLAPAALDVKAGELPLRVTVSGERLFGDRLLSGRIEIPEFAPRQALQTLGVDLPATADATAFSKLALTSAWRLTPAGIALADLDATLDDTRLRGGASIDTSGSVPALGFDLDAGALDVDRYLSPPGAGGSADGGAKTARAAARLPFDLLRSFDARGSLRAQRVRIAGLDFATLRIPVDLRGGVLRADGTQAAIFGGSYRGTVTVDARPAAAQVSLDAKLAAADVGAIVQALFDSQRLVGRGDATVHLVASGSTKPALLRSASGRVDFNVRDGAVRGIDLWYELRRARALVRGETLPVGLAADRTSFETFRGSALIDAGVVRSDDLRIETQYLKARGAGTLRIDTGAVDYRLVAALYRMPAAGQEGAEMADLKAAEIPIAITGTLGDLRVRPDVEAVVKSRVRQKLQDATQSAEGELRSRLGKKLRGLLGGE